MKLTKLFIAVICVFAMSTLKANAKMVILYGNGPEFELLTELPDSVTSEDGNHLNFGITFEQFSVFGVPIWNYGECTYALYDKANETIYSIDEETIAYLKETYNLTIEEEPKPGFWNRFGGKILVLIIIVGALVFLWKKHENDEEESQQQETAKADSE